jgi:hypothetical protein
MAMSCCGDAFECMAIGQCPLPDCQLQQLSIIIFKILQILWPLLCRYLRWYRINSVLRQFRRAQSKSKSGMIQAKMVWRMVDVRGG